MACGARRQTAVRDRDEEPLSVRAIAGIWENWKDPASAEWLRTFAVITVPATPLVSQIHDRMPAILKPESYDRWLGIEPDPRDLLIACPAELMSMWSISKRVNTPKVCS
jgi:putative SOS response-associated peptidase YedK